MTTNPEHERMRNVLLETARILYPLADNLEEAVIPHVWRNVDYVGESNGRVASWSGWSINLGQFNGLGHTVYFDKTDNALAADERVRLFGRAFANKVDGMSQFLFAYVAGLPPHSSDLLQSQGFSIRVMGRTIHAGLILSLAQFAQLTDLHWAAHVARLINLQTQILSS